MGNFLSKMSTETQQESTKWMSAQEKERKLNHTRMTEIKKKAIHTKTFLGEETDTHSAEEHIHRLETIGMDNKYNDIEMNYLLKTTLRSTASQWLEAWYENDINIDPNIWQETKGRFLNIFGTENEEKPETKANKEEYREKFETTKGTNKEKTNAQKIDFLIGV